MGETPIVGAPRSDQRPPALEQVAGPLAPRRFPLILPETIVGRHPQSHLYVDSASLSRQHVRLVQRDGEVTFTDLDSANGVLLNGVRAHSAVLREADVLQLGDVVFVFREGSR